MVIMNGRQEHQGCHVLAFRNTWLFNVHQNLAGIQMPT